MEDQPAPGTPTEDDGGEWRTQGKSVGGSKGNSSQGPSPVATHSAGDPGAGSPRTQFPTEESQYLASVVQYITRRGEAVTCQVVGAQLPLPRSSRTGGLAALLSTRPDVFCVYYHADSAHPWVKLAMAPEQALEALQHGDSRHSWHPVRGDASSDGRATRSWGRDAYVPYNMSKDGGDDGGHWRKNMGYGQASYQASYHREWEPSPQAVAAYDQDRVYVAGGSTINRMALRQHFSEAAGPVRSVYHAPTEARACFITFETVHAARAALSLGVHTVSGTNGRVVQCKPYVSYNKQSTQHEDDSVTASGQEQMPAGSPQAVSPAEGTVSYAKVLKDPLTQLEPPTPNNTLTQPHLAKHAAAAGGGPASEGTCSSQLSASTMVVDSSAGSDSGGSHGRSDSLHSNGHGAYDMMMTSGSGGEEAAMHQQGHAQQPMALPTAVSGAVPPGHQLVMMMPQNSGPGGAQPVVMMMAAPAPHGMQSHGGGVMDMTMLNGLLAVLSPAVATAVKIELHAKSLWPGENPMWSAPPAPQQRAVYYQQ